MGGPHIDLRSARTVQMLDLMGVKVKTEFGPIYSLGTWTNIIYLPYSFFKADQIHDKQ
jgi:hypothetical protein